MPDPLRFRIALPAAALLAAVALHPAPILAWGATGHRVIGAIAESRLSPEARAAVAELIGRDSLPRVGTWADEIRVDPAWAKADAWHYVNIPDGGTYASAKKNEAGDLLEAIGRFSRLLADRAAPREERATALKFLVHFLGDLHQPLHVGRAEDRGGNDIVVLYFNEPANLHSVWDSGMIDGSKLSYSELTAFIDRIEPEQEKAWQAGEPLDWAKESMTLRAQVYEVGDRRLGLAYVQRNWPTVEIRLAQAGVRLATLLESLLGPAPEEPPATPAP